VDYWTEAELTKAPKQDKHSKNQDRMGGSSINSPRRSIEAERYLDAWSRQELVIHRYRSTR